jgi:hypothetical protein
MKGTILTELARACKDDIQERLEKLKLRDYFKGAKAIKCLLTVYTPKETYLTANGDLSKTSIDFDAHKLFMDEISKYFGFNDGLICEFEFDKQPIDGCWCFGVVIMDWSSEVCLVPLKEDIVIGTLSSQGYQVLS